MLPYIVVILPEVVERRQALGLMTRRKTQPDQLTLFDGCNIRPYNNGNGHSNKLADFARLEISNTMQKLPIGEGSSGIQGVDIE